MTEVLWSDVDAFFADRLATSDDALETALSANADAGLPAIDVSAAQGKMLELLVRMAGARRVLEIGTLGGYSTIRLARGVGEGGRVVTLEFDPKHAAVAGENLARAGLAERVEIRVGRALDTLPRLAEEGSGSFDFVFRRRRQALEPGLSRLGRAARAAGGHDRRRQRRARRAHPRRRDDGCRRGRHAGAVRRHRGRAAPLRHRDPDRGRQGLGRLRAGDPRLSLLTLPKAEPGARPGPGCYRMKGRLS